MRVATISNGVVSEVHEINRPIADFPDVGYVEAGQEVVIGFTYDGSTFTPHATHAAEVEEASAAALEVTTLADAIELVNALETRLAALEATP